jgi:nitrite reductase (NADH) small subunit
MATNEWLRVCSIDDIPVSGARVLRVAGQPDIAVFRTLDDQVFALRDHCPHKGGPLSQGIVHGARVTCPLHAWVIELDKGNAVEPDIGSTPCYRVRCEGREVLLRRSELAQPIDAAEIEVCTAS